MLDWLKRTLGLGPHPAPAPAWRPPEGPPIHTLDDLGALVDRFGYGEAKLEILALAAPVFHIIAGPPAPNAPLGQTRLGGAPDLPIGMDWPQGRFGPAGFLGQFDLADVAARTGSSDLPASGLLSLFVVEIESAADPVEVLSLVTATGTPLTRLSPPTGETGAFGQIGLLKPVSIAAFRPGLSIAQSDLDRLDLASRFPGQDSFDFEILLDAKPEGAVGEWRGRGFDNGHGDQRQVAHGRRIGRPDLARYAFIEGWDEWLELKQRQMTMANGGVYRPWSDKGDPDVRWLLDHRPEFDAGVEALQMLVRLESNKPMNLWINDADPIFILIDQEHLSRDDLSHVHATVTQG